MIDVLPPQESAGLLLAILQGSGFDVAAVRVHAGGHEILRAIGVHGDELVRLRQVCERWAPGTRVLSPAA